MLPNVAEVRIGELLGDGKATQGRKLEARVRDVARRDRVRFRLLAASRDLVLRLIREEGKTKHVSLMSM